MSIIITPGSVLPSENGSWMFAWTVETTIPPPYSGRLSNAFSFKGHEVHLKLTNWKYDDTYHAVQLCTPPSFPSLSVDDMMVRVETKNKTPLDLPNNYIVGPDDKRFWIYSENQILAKYPDFRKDGGILTFLLCDVDPPKAIQTAEKFVQTTEHSYDVSSLERLSSDLSMMLKNQVSGPDLELLCGEGHSIKVHKNIVSARSTVMSIMLNSDMSESRTGRIEIKDMDSEVFDHFVRYLYAGKLPDLNEDIARGLYEAGDQYEVTSLMRRCKIFLLENLTPKNACELLVLADAHSDQEFKDRAMDYIVKNKIPLQEDHWLPFHGTYPKLSSEVLYCFCKWVTK